jgi:lipopolysaccharide/colanic/teichoic acid biosynthesis glycosyltransferase
MLFVAVATRVLAFPRPGSGSVITRLADSWVKRSLDIIGAALGLLLCAPFFVILPILIKLDSPGPVFYMQDRIGHNRRRRQRRETDGSSLGRSGRDRRRIDLKGRPFQVIKFRTMVVDAEKKCGPVWATRNDPRVTRLGRLLRKTRLDEIPQFVNVLLGHMSLVGPRPERPHFVEDLSGKVENYVLRLQVKPGLTGLAQIENGYDSSMSAVVRKVHYDLEYIRNWSIWQDVKILFRTIGVVITGKGAF